MAERKHAEILRAGMEEWNAWRAENPTVFPDLSGERFALDCTGLDLSHAIALGTRFDGSRLPGLKLCGATARGISLIDVLAPDLDATQADLTGAVMHSLFAGGGTFDETVLNGAHGDRFQAPGGDFVLAKMARFRGANCDLSKAALRHCVLEDAWLTETRMHRTLVERCSLKRSILTSTNWSVSAHVQNDYEHADLSFGYVYGMLCWAPYQLDRAKQSSMFFGAGLYGEDSLAIDGLELALAMQAYLRSDLVREVLPVVSSRLVLVVGCWSESQRYVPAALGDLLRRKGRTAVYINALEERLDLEPLRRLAMMATSAIVDFTSDSKALREIVEVLDAQHFTIQPVVNPASGVSLERLVPAPKQATMREAHVFRSEADLSRVDVQDGVLASDTR
jgi:uncharacterized protein YjbI with pentapeptide repeats